LVDEPEVNSVPLVQPTVLQQPIAYGRSDNVTPIPVGSANPNVVSLDQGYPVTQKIPYNQGGFKTVKEEETNGLFNYISKYTSFQSSGGQYTFDPAIVPLGGYAQGAILFNPTSNAWFKSLVNNNTDSTFSAANWLQITATPTQLVAFYQQGRLGVVSGNPYTDNKYSTTLYFSPGKEGNLISLYNTSTNNWQTVTFSELSLNVSTLTAGTIYDVYVGNNNTGTSPTTLTTYAWTNNTTAPAGRVTQDGRIVYTSNKNQLFVGSVYVQTTTTADITVTGYAQQGMVMHPNNFYAYQYSNGAGTDANIKLYKRDNQGGLTFISDQANAHNRPDCIIASVLNTATPPVLVNYLYSLNTDSSSLDIWRINNDGTLSSTSSDTGLTNVTQRLALLNTSTAHYLYATSYSTSTGPGNIYQYRINSDGSLTALTPATISVGQLPVGIKTITLGANSFVYVCNSGDSTINVCTVAATGALTIRDTVSTSTIAVTDIQISPDKSHVYACGPTGLIIFSIDQTTGALSNPITHSTAGGNRIIISNDNNYLYVGNITNATLNQFSITSTGDIVSLTPVSVTLENNFINMVQSIDGQNVYVLDNSTSTATPPVTTSVIETFFNWNGGLLQKTFNAFSSWKGQRYLYNYYNQVKLLMHGYIYNGGNPWKTASTVPTTSILMYPQNNDTSYGGGRIGLIIDPTMQNFELSVTGVVDSDNASGEARRELSIGLDNNNSIFNIGRNSVGGLVFLGSTTATSNTISGYTIPVGLEVPVDINNFQNPFGSGVPNNIYGVHYFQRLEGSDSNGTIFYENNGLTTFIFA
jgi:6-phosphogluconolactonase (cycloisomerase 2 family)